MMEATPQVTAKEARSDAKRYDDTLRFYCIPVKLTWTTGFGCDTTLSQCSSAQLRTWHGRSVNRQQLVFFPLYFFVILSLDTSMAHGVFAVFFS